MRPRNTSDATRVDYVPICDDCGKVTNGTREESCACLPPLSVTIAQTGGGGQRGFPDESRPDEYQGPRPAPAKPSSTSPYKPRSFYPYRGKP